MEVGYSNQRGERGRKPWLLLVRGDEIFVFGGQNLSGLVAVKGTDYEQNGKWSHTTYRLLLADGVRAIAGRDGWETGRFAEGLAAAVGCPTPDTWPAVAAALGVSVPSAMGFLRAWRPRAAERLDATELALAELESLAGKATDPVIVTVSFGSPTNRMIAAGYWEAPKAIPGHEGAEIRLLDPGKGWVEGNITVAGISGTVVSVRYSAGHHGGYYAVSVAVVE